MTTNQQIADFENMQEDFRERDAITGRKMCSVLNRKKVSVYELDEIFAGEL